MLFLKDDDHDPVIGSFFDEERIFYVQVIKQAEEIKKLG